MAEHILERTQRLPLPTEEVFAYFADAHNLEALTPPFLHFRIVTEGEIEMREGALIEYGLRMHGVPVRWRTEIKEWVPDGPKPRFVDEQISGPFSLWHHTHTFEAIANEAGPDATQMRDRVRYKIPLGPLGEVARMALIGRDLEKIFDFRRDEIARGLASQS